MLSPGKGKAEWLKEQYAYSLALVLPFAFGVSCEDGPAEEDDAEAFSSACWRRLRARLS